MKRAGVLCGVVAALAFAASGVLPRLEEAAGAAPQQEKTHITCPVSVRVGARDVPEGWNVVASATLMFVEAQTTEQSRLLMCTYRSKELGEHSIMRIAPEGYGCRLSAPGGQGFVCTRRPKAPVRIK